METINLKTKIKDAMACRFAEAVSYKAFEHLTKPAYNAVADEMEKAHDQQIAGIPQDILDKLEEADVIETSNTLCYNGYKEGEMMYWVNMRCSRREKYYFSSIKTNPDLMAAAKAYQAIEDRRNELRRTIQDQIGGKTVGQVINHWPELEPMFKTMYNFVDAPDGFVVPFESLLAKYLPALPAPDAEEA